MNNPQPPRVPFTFPVLYQCSAPKGCTGVFRAGPTTIYCRMLVANGTCKCTKVQDAR